MEITLKKVGTLSMIGLIWGFAAQLQADELSSIAVGFELIEPGKLSKEEISRAFGKIDWEALEERAIVRRDGGGKVLEVNYPRGAVASGKSGAQFVIELEQSRYATLSYRFRPGPGFPFVKGGKLPGMTSGGSRFTGGRPPGKAGGWSARYMWRREGALELYFYHPGMKSQYGERHALKTTLVPGKWVELIQRIDTGEPGKKDGVIEIDVDGETKLRLEELELHGTKYGPVDSFFFSTFFGGNSSSWAPPEDASICFDDFLISPEKPDFSSD
ncbi:MAG: hypothetical protein P1U58_04880 [Verrucomicrobiales bacterium]|nr:hypothetical protein [Verrucomicrobiales bacterium]